MHHAEHAFWRTLARAGMLETAPAGSRLGAAGAGGGLYSTGYTSGAMARTERPLVLVADDDVSIRELLADTLTELDVRVATARDGAEALDMVARQAPALAVLDVQMPRVDGTEVCRRLKADPATRDLPVVAISAGERRGVAIEAGCDAFVAKPFDLDDLLAAVRDRLPR